MQPVAFAFCPTVCKGRNPGNRYQEDSMMHLLVALMRPDEIFSGFGLWAFLSVGAVALFGIFIPVTSWIDGRRKEREAFYKAETFRRLTESSSEGAKMAMEMFQQENRQERLKHRQGIVLGGMVNIGVGAGLSIMLWSMEGSRPGSPYLVGLIPGLIGVALLVYGLFMAPAADDGRKG
jgi:hypothetical protein